MLNNEYKTLIRELDRLSVDNVEFDGNNDVYYITRTLPDLTQECIEVESGI